MGTGDILPVPILPYSVPKLFAEFRGTAAGGFHRSTYDVTQVRAFEGGNGSFRRATG